MDELLDLVEFYELFDTDDEEYEEGSAEFEAAVLKLNQKRLESAPCQGINPREIIRDLEDSREFYIKKIKEFKEFDVHYKEIQEIVREQPELFI